MITYIAKRFFQLIPVLLGVTFLTFALTLVAPSDPAQMQFESMGMQADPEVLEAMREEMGLNRPFLVQYGDWLLDVIQGDFGDSVKYNRPVVQELKNRLPNTLILALSSFTVMLVCSFPLGILSAVYHNRAADYIIRYLSFVGVSMPSFWFGLLVMYYFGVRLQVLPLYGTGSIYHLILPTATLSIYLTAVYIRRIRAGILEEMNQPYVRGALARGVGKGKIIFFHVLPNSLLALVTMMGMSLGNLLGGTTIVEMIFSWNGIGKMAADSISSRDYALIQGYVIWIACIYVGINLAVDLLYHFLNPRIRLGGKQG